MATEICVHFLFLVLSVVSSLSKDLHFAHDIQGHDAVNGYLKLKSEGSLADVINIDAIPDVKAAIDSDGRLVVSLRDAAETKTWTPGRYIFGSKLREKLPDGNIKETSAFGQIRHVEIINPSKVKVVFDKAKGLEILNEADIFLSYSPLDDAKAPAHHRQKRYISNLLSTVLDNVDWQANDTNDEINFNFDKTTSSALKAITLYKQSGIKGLHSETLPTDRVTVPTNTDFYLKCTSCYETRRVSNMLDFALKREEKVGSLKRFVLQTDVNVAMNTKFDLKFTQALGLQERVILESTPETVLRQIPVANVISLPPVLLVLSYNKTVYLEVNATADGPLEYSGNYHVEGQYTTNSKQLPGSSPTTQLSTTVWRVSNTGVVGNSSALFNLSIALYQEVLLKASVRWLQHDVALLFAPPDFNVLKPSFNLATSTGVFDRCVRGHLTLGAYFDVGQSDFIAKAFHRQIWDIVLRDKYISRRTLINQDIFQQCSANCFGDEEIGPPQGMNDLCGAPSSKIVRGESSMDRLTVVSGDFILFLSEETKSATWCGKPGRQCQMCTSGNQGTDKNDVCADRLMTSEAASLLTKLGKLAKNEWPLRKLVVIESWDEPTSQHPQGKHGSVSLHYEGRALQIGLSVELSTKTGASSQVETGSSYIRRLSQLSVCAGFPFVSQHPGFVQTCVTDSHSKSRSRRSIRHVDFNDDVLARQDFEDRIKSVASTMSTTCSTANMGTKDTIPAGAVFNDLINPPLDREDMKDRLYQYPFNDVTFTAEGNAGDTCLEQTRICKDTCDHVDSTEPWDWCQTRTMTPRLAFRLKRLAYMVSTGGKGLIVASKPLLPQGQQTTGSNMLTDLSVSGRSLRLSLPANSGINVGRFTGMAACAGFDLVKSVDSTHVDVFVRLQEGFRASVVPFQENTILLAVLPPLSDQKEYQYPATLVMESRKPLLFDGFNDRLPLSQHFTIKDFKHPDRRFFRLDSSLIDCLELAIDDFDTVIEVIHGSAYRSKSINRRNLGHRHPEEKFRFEMGQAVYIRPQGSVSDSRLSDLGLSLLRSCSPFLRLQTRGLGIGAHSDKIYLDIRPIISGMPSDIGDVWNVENKHVYDIISETMDQLRKGGPAIVPLNLQRTCKPPKLGEDLAYFSFNANSLGFCFYSGASKFCTETHENRKKEAEKLRTSLIKAAGNNLKRSNIDDVINNCVVIPCGGCPGKGTEWDKKVKYCIKMVQIYLDKAKNPFQDVQDQAAFFNTDNTESSVHSLACHDGSLCVENTQIYSLLLPQLNAKYKPDPGKSREELLFSGEDNASPLMSIVEQEFAKNVAGRVKVFIEKDVDMSVLKNVLKILMIHNRRVKEVEFHLADTVDRDGVVSSLQRKLEHWAGTTCPHWSRFAVAPFKIIPIPHARRKRSLERSKARNKIKQDARNWELDWIFKT